MKVAEIGNAIAAHFTPDGRIVIFQNSDAVDWDYRLSVPFAIYGMFCQNWSTNACALSAANLPISP